MIVNRAEAVNKNFLAFLDGWEKEHRGGSVRALDETPWRYDTSENGGSEAGSARDPGGPATLTGRVLVELFESQITARLLDLVAREMRARDEGYYTIGGIGHEGNVVLGRLSRFNDPAFLHYRSCALFVERARHFNRARNASEAASDPLPAPPLLAGGAARGVSSAGGRGLSSGASSAGDIDAIRDILLSYTASAEEPIAGGRHKVLGSRPLWIPPQTSTIASQLPKSVGAAIALGRMKKLRLPIPVPPAGRDLRNARLPALPPVPADAIVLCSFGDASVNHSVTQGAFNTASWTAYQNVPVPILFVCEDNGIGISVHTPPGWVETSMRNRPGVRYFKADGLDLVDAYRVAAEAVDYCRTSRSPTFLHMRTVRLLGHAGSDVETEYHSIAEIEAVEAMDPLIATARRMLEEGFATVPQIREMYEALAAKIRGVAAEVAKRPKLTSPAEVMKPLAPYHADSVNAEARRTAGHAERIAAFGAEELLPERRGVRHFAVLQNWGLHDALVKYPQAVIFGEDVAQKGGVYHVTTGLHKKFGPARVFNTLLDETSILGLAIGAAHFGMLPIPEIQYLAYFHNAEDQIRGEACSLQFFSNAQFSNPMVVRIASLGYQKGFGGHFHNDNSIGALRDIPGLVIALPSRGDDAVRMMRTCLALARIDGRVVAFLEPIALYMTKDLHAQDDKAWLFEYPRPGEAIPLGEGRVYHPDAGDLTIVTFGNGVHMSLRAAKTLADQHGIHARVVDLRWLAPLNAEFIVEQARATGRLLVVDECRRTGGGVAEAIFAAIVEATGAGPPIAMQRITAEDTYIPLGPAANLVLPQESQIVAAARRMLPPAKTTMRAPPQITPPRSPPAESPPPRAPAKPPGKTQIQRRKPARRKSAGR